MRRLRTLLALGALVIGAASFAFTSTPRVATAAGSLDVYNVMGDASAVELAVKNPYSFVVEPDSQLPRATASIEDGLVSALASPADPGHSLDTPAGLVVPPAEAGISSGLTDPKCGAGQAPE